LNPNTNQKTDKEVIETLYQIMKELIKIINEDSSILMDGSEKAKKISRNHMWNRKQQIYHTIYK
jgi:hypothetical protein